MLLDGRHGSAANGQYRYGFQGQERDDEVKGEGNSVNYKYRMHDPRIGRFFAVDPLTAKYPHYTPYSFSGNEVISAVELEGLEPKHLSGDGEISSAQKNGEGPMLDWASTGDGGWSQVASTTDVYASQVEIGDAGWMSERVRKAGDGQYWIRASAPALPGGFAWTKQDHNLWEDVSPHYNDVSGYEYTIEDLKVRYDALNGSGGRSVIDQAIEGREAEGRGLPLTQETAVDHFGADMYNLIRLGRAAEIGLPMGGASYGGPRGSTRGYQGYVRGWAASTAKPMYHYTTEAGFKGIMASKQLNPSVGAKNARYGTGQYLTDIAPGMMTRGQTSHRLYGVPWNGSRLTHHIKIDTRGLKMINNKPHNFLNPSSTPLDLKGRILGGGASKF